MRTDYALSACARLALIAALAFFVFLEARAQGASLRGQVSGPFGGRVVDAPLRAVDVASGESWQTRTDADGRYEFGDLPAGSVRVQVRIPCCEYTPYQSDPVELGQGEAQTLDIELAQGFQLNTLGDDVGIATAQILASREVPDLPVPTTPDGRPDLTGFWMYGEDPFPVEPALNDWAAELARERTANQFIESPRIRCLPTSLPIPTHTPPIFGKFLQTPGLTVLLFEGVLGYRQIFTDGRGHPEDPNPSWLGHSIGSWEGDEFVVDTVGFNDRGWTGLTHPRTEQFHVVERYRRTSYGEMELTLIIEDPEVYREPWVRQMTLYLTPNQELMEYVCENEKWVGSFAE